MKIEILELETHRQTLYSTRFASCATRTACRTRCSLRCEEDGHFMTSPLHWSNPDQALSQRRFFEVLEHCMEELPKTAAQVFAMREVMGLDTDEMLPQPGHHTNQLLGAAIPRTHDTAQLP